ncbi:hypothetical protein HGG70_05160 [Rhodobacteraceae bacterium R_SAG4]|nr:hypothetical protein [Rhodobacteraceae bacterium R_SAG4]
MKTVSVKELREIKARVANTLGEFRENSAQISWRKYKAVSLVAQFSHFVVVGAQEDMSVEAVVVADDGSFLAVNCTFGLNEVHRTLDGDIRRAPEGFSTLLTTVREWFLQDQTKQRKSA